MGARCVIQALYSSERSSGYEFPPDVGQHAWGDGVVARLCLSLYYHILCKFFPEEIVVYIAKD